MHSSNITDEIDISHTYRYRIEICISCWFLDLPIIGAPSCLEFFYLRSPVGQDLPADIVKLHRLTVRPDHFKTMFTWQTLGYIQPLWMKIMLPPTRSPEPSTAIGDFISQLFQFKCAISSERCNQYVCSPYASRSMKLPLRRTT